MNTTTIRNNSPILLTVLAATFQAHFNSKKIYPENLGTFWNILCQLFTNNDLYNIKMPIPTICHPKWEQNHPKLCENRVVVHEKDTVNTLLFYYTINLLTR